MTHDVPDALATRLARLLRNAVDTGRHVRHGLAAVGAADASWTWAGAHGVLDTEGRGAGTAARYPVASVTKLFTAVVTMRMVEQGRLSLEDRLVDHLTELGPLHVTAGVDRTAEITVRHLMAHTSGLPDYYEEAPPGEASAQARLLSGEDAPVPFDEVLDIVRRLTPHFPPQPIDGRKARYADTNYQLLGAVIESVHGADLREVFASVLFGPLGLQSTSAYPHPPSSGGSPEPDVRVWAKDVVLKPGGALTHQKADGGIVSTLDDQLTFMRALVGGRIFDDPATWARMTQRMNRVFFPIDYGLGVMRYAPPRWMSPMYAIPPVIGHTGSTATWLFHSPDPDLVLAGTFDVARPQIPFRFVPRILRAVATASS